MTELAYVCKTCFHSSEDHNPIGGWDAGHCSGNRCECEQLSEEKATVIEVMNHEYGSCYTAATLEYARETPKWPHSVDLGKNGWNLAIRNTTHMECHGYDDPINSANYLTLQENWSEYEALCDQGWSNCYSIGLQWDSPAPADLIDVIKQLEDYPVLDESRWSELETEWMQRDWESYGLTDAKRVLSKMLGDIEIPDCFDDMIRDDVFGNEVNPPYYESGGGTVFSDAEVLNHEAAKYWCLIWSLV